MLHNLEQFTRKYVSFNSIELFTLASLFKPMSLNENDFVIKKNQLVSNIYFLDSGIIKSYINNSKMSNVKFYFGPIFFSDLSAISNKKGTNRNFTSVKKSTIFIASFEDIIKLNTSSEKHKIFFKMIFEDDYMFNSNFII